MNAGAPLPTRSDTPPAVRLLVGGTVGTGLVLVSTYSFLLFHSLAELFSIVIGSALFLIAWNSRRIASNDFLLFLGIGYLAVSGIDVLHLLAFPGLNVLGEGRGLSSQLWLAARAVEASTLLIAPIYLRRRVRPSFAFTGFAAATTALLVTAFVGWFPRTVAGDSLTPFKSVSEVVIALAFAGALALLWRRRADVDASVLRYVMASIALRLTSELSLVVYSDPYGIANLVGHLLKIAASYLLYKGLIENLLMRPYATLFKSMKEHEEQLNEAVGELESFSHSVSHDLRTPLTAVTGFGELLLYHGAELNDAQREYATQIVGGAHRMTEIVDGLMQLTKLSRDEIEIGAVDLSSLCADVVDSLRRSDPDRAIDISIQPGLYADGDPRLP
ncbi:MAG: sensor histidine kinase [Thermoanaerobaculia bacterium]